MKTSTLARTLQRTRAKVRPRREERRQPPHPNSVEVPLDSWTREHQPGPEPVRPRPSRSREAPTPEVPEISRERTNDVQHSKRRDKNVSISVSNEERLIIRSFLQEHKLHLSEWARKVLFDAMGKEIPSRR